MKMKTMYLKNGTSRCRVREIEDGGYEIAMINVPQSGEPEVFYLERFRTVENLLRKLVEKGVIDTEEIWTDEAIPVGELMNWIESCV
jgi:hypothetical protein